MNYDYADGKVKVNAMNIYTNVLKIGLRVCLNMLDHSLSTEF